MGNCASVAPQPNYEEDPNIGSNEILQCDQCKSDFEKLLLSCKQCKQTVCSACCVHLSPSTKETKVGHQQQFKEKQLKNRFFGSNVSAMETHSLRIKSTKASRQQVRCATIVKDGKLAFLSQLIYEDYLDESFKWKLCYLNEKPKYVTKRKDMGDIHIFPGDICYIITKRELYLTLPCKQMVYKLPDGENFHNAFSTPLGSCFGITSFDNGLALSVEIPKRFHEIPSWQIQYVDFKGIVKRRIQNDTNGVALFSKPLFLTSNADDTILFVSDNGNGSVTAFDVKGHVIFRFNRLAVVHPLGITADRYNNVYVACGSKVIQIKAGGVEYKKMLEVSDWDKIVSVCMDQNTNTLFTISEWGKVSSFEFGHIDSTGQDQIS